MRTLVAVNEGKIKNDKRNWHWAMFDVSTYAHSFFSCLMYLSMISHPFGCFILIWSVAVERSVRVNGVSLVFPNMSLLRAMVDCHSLVTYPRRLRLCMRYASSRLLFDFSTPFRLQSNKLLVIFGETLVVKSVILNILTIIERYQIKVRILPLLLFVQWFIESAIP